MKLRKYYPTIVLSDIHLGSEHSRTEEVTNFLKHVNCGRLILNGDIIDGWQLRKSGRRWKQQHTDFFKVLMKMMEKQGTEIIYVRGNHDDFLDNLVPFTFSNLSIVKDYILNTHGKRYLVTHGDIFDTVTTNMRWLAMLGDMGYTFLLWLNRIYNQRREKAGKPYFSLSQHVKHKVKTGSQMPGLPVPFLSGLPDCGYRLHVCSEVPVQTPDIYDSGFLPFLHSQVFFQIRLLL